MQSLAGLLIYLVIFLGLGLNPIDIGNTETSMTNSHETAQNYLKGVGPKRVSRVVKLIKTYNTKISDNEALMLYKEVHVQLRQAQLSSNVQLFKSFSSDLLLSLIIVESRCNSKALSSQGAIGLTQIVPKWHMKALYSQGIVSSLNPYELYSVSKNIRASLYILNSYAKVSKSIEEVLARYNAGNNYRKGLPYSRKVLTVYNKNFGRTYE